MVKQVVKVLVHDMAPSKDRDEALKEAHKCAMEATEVHEADAALGRHPLAGGFLAGHEPQEVVIGRDDPERILREVVDARAAQKAELEECIGDLSWLADMPFEKAVWEIWNGGGYGARHALGRIGDILQGSIENGLRGGLYLAESGSAWIPQWLPQSVRKHPEEYALAVFEAW